MMPAGVRPPFADIAEYSNVSRAVFEQEIQPRSQPAVMRGLGQSWPLVQASSAPLEQLQRVANVAPNTQVKAFVGPPEINGRFFYNDDFSGFNFKHREIALAELTAMLAAHVDEPRPPAIYAGAIQLKGKLEEIRAANCHALLPPDLEQLASIWIGNRGVTAAHWDLPQNIACVAAGTRRFTVFPPDQLVNLYIGPLDVTLAGQPISLVDLKEPDFEAHPRFRDALASASTAVLEPGDAIYIPSMWFHHVENLSAIGMLLNFWWRDAAPYMFTPLFTLFHALLSIRDLPEEEREIWRGMFDHYIFQSNGEPMEHVPEHARGVFQDMTDERVVALRNFLVHTLGGELKR